MDNPTYRTPTENNVPSTKNILSGIPINISRLRRNDDKESGKQHVAMEGGMDDRRFVRCASSAVDEMCMLLLKLLLLLGNVDIFLIVML